MREGLSYMIASNTNHLSQDTLPKPQSSTAHNNDPHSTESTPPLRLISVAKDCHCRVLCAVSLPLNHLAYVSLNRMMVYHGGHTLIHGTAPPLRICCHWRVTPAI